MCKRDEIPVVDLLPPGEGFVPARHFGRQILVRESAKVNPGKQIGLGFHAR